MADVKWIKIATEVFDNRKIKQIENMPEGDSIIVIWFKILCLAGNTNDNGMIYFTKEIPYTEQMLASEFKRKLNIVQLALKVFESFGMIEIVDDIILVSSWEKYQNIEGLERIREKTRQRVAKHRENKMLPCNATCNVTVTQGNAIELELEIDKDKDKDIKKKTKELANAQTYFDDEKLNSTFVDFMNMRKSIKNGKMTERAITMMINKLNKYDIDTAITMLEKSILNNWKDVYDLTQQPKHSTTSKNKFNQFPQRQYTGQDYSSLEQALLNKGR